MAKKYIQVQKTNQTSVFPFEEGRKLAQWFDTELQTRSHDDVVRSLVKNQGLSQQQVAELMYAWSVWARGPDVNGMFNPQHERLLQYHAWTHWVLLAGRGFGKTRCGTEWVREQIESGNMTRIALIARTPRDAERVMVNGPSGLLNICPPWNRPIWEPSKGLLTWPNGGQALVYSSEKPDQLRGPEHDGYWADELAAWRFLQESWDNLGMGLRLTPKDGRPRGLITTTPRALPLLKLLVGMSRHPGLKCEEAHPNRKCSQVPAVRNANSGRVYLIQASTLENAANWPPDRLAELMESYEGTRAGRQEIYAEILEDTAGALWCSPDIVTLEHLRGAELSRVVVAVDPQKSSQGQGRAKSSDVHEHRDKSAPNCSTGIVACARDFEGQGYVLEDYTIDGKPEEWADRAIQCYDATKADCIVAEVNAGGDMVEAVIRARRPNIPVKQVHASRGKLTRAEPISMLYKARPHKMFHYGHLAELEEQMTSWDPNTSESPDRVDALVWGMTDLFMGGGVGDGDQDFGRYGQTRGWGQAGAYRRW